MALALVLRSQQQDKRESATENENSNDINKQDNISVHTSHFFYHFLSITAQP